jgi:type IV secretory pathway VirB2 component (pilin)
MMKKYRPLLLAIGFNLAPILAQADIRSAMDSFRSQLTSVFLPVLALVGIVIAGISLALGNHNAKSHIYMAVVGTIIAFGADNIIEFARRTFGGGL